MNGPGPLSPPPPSSVASSEWSPSRYQTTSPKPYSLPTGRAHLPTPPISGSSMNGMNGPFVPGMNGMSGPRPGGEFRGNPSPPSSVGRSSNGTQLSQEAQRRKQSMMEDSLGQHYGALKRYLAATLAQEANDGRPNRARDKLVRLSPTQFQELSTDVYDELLRRQAQQAGTIPPNAPKFLIPRDTFHPKRNQARQKLSTLPAPRFRALATDVFFELERRFPRFAGGNIGRGGSPAIGPPSRTGTPNGMRPGSSNQMRRLPPRQGSLGGQVLAGGMPGMGDGPMQKSSQSNTIVPNKSYLVEDDDDGDLDSVYGGGRRDTTQTNKSFSANEKIITDYQNKVEELQGRIGDLEKQVQEKDEALRRAVDDHQGSSRDMDSASAEWSRVREELEDKVANAQNLNNSLRAEIDRMKSLDEEKEREFQDQLNILAQKGSDGGEWRGRYEDIKAEHAELQRVHDELQRDLGSRVGNEDEVRKEVVGLLNEMRAISDHSDAQYEREEKLNQQVTRMEDEVREWKDRYARLKTRTGDSGFPSASVQQPGFSKSGLIQPGGLIKDINMTKYQVAMDEAIRASRSTDATAMIETMRSVVVCVKAIMAAVPNPSGTDQESQKPLKLRNRVEGMAKNFATAMKNHAVSKGISPISLVDAAASNLSMVIVELIHLVKLCPTPPEELEVDEQSGMPYAEKSSKYLSSNGRSSFSESVYSNQTGAARASQKMNLLPSTSYRAPSTNGLPNGKDQYAAQETFDVQEGDEDVEELRLYLDDQTAILVETTQTLVSSIRSGAPASSILPVAASIANLVTSILQRADPVLAGNYALNASSGHVVQNLADAKSRLQAAEDDGRNVRSEEEWRGVVNSMPPIAFEIARVVKEFGAVLGEEGEDDFR